MSPVRNGSQSQNTETWKELVRSQNIVLISALPGGTDAGTVVSSLTAPAQAEPEDNRLFGTHIREAINILRGTNR